MYNHNIFLEVTIRSAGLELNWSAQVRTAKLTTEKEAPQTASEYLEENVRCPHVIIAIQLRFTCVRCFIGFKNEEFLRSR